MRKDLHKSALQVGICGTTGTDNIVEKVKHGFVFFTQTYISQFVLLSFMYKLHMTFSIFKHLI